MTRDDRPYDVLFRDGDVIVVNKSPGLLSQPDRGNDPDLLTLLSHKIGHPVFPIHRLDRGVGGLIAVAVNQRAAGALSSLVSDGNGAFVKEYLAVVHGRFDAPSGELSDHLLREEKRRITRVVPAGTPGAKPARLAYFVLGETDLDGRAFSLVAVRLFTGRTHQIRAQFSNAGHPVAGDGRYGAHDRFPPIALYSAYLSFPHPGTGERLVFSAAPTLPPFDRFVIPSQGEKGFFDD